MTVSNSSKKSVCCIFTIISSYINEIRVEKAKELLTHSDEKIYGIAEKIGYASTTAFHVAFKKKTGMTPAEYRNQNYR